MKILYVVPAISTGGIENLISRYGNYFQSCGNIIEVLSFRDGNCDTFNFVNRKYVISLSNYNFLTHHVAIRDFFKTHNDYDVVHSNVHYYNGIIAKYANSVGIKVIISHVHSNGGKCSSFISALVNKLYNYYLRVLIIKYSTNCLACSYMSGDLMYKNKRLYEYFPNCIETSLYKFNMELRCSIRNKLGISEKDIVLLHVGRFSIEKNHIFLLKIFKCLLSVVPNCQLLLLGEGELKKSCEEYCVKNNINEKVHFLGYNKNVSPFYQTADVFLLPSFFEGMPVSLIEAQAAGLFSIVSSSIPQEVIVSNRVKRLSLKLSEDEWACQIPTSLNIYNREDYSDIIYNAKLDYRFAFERLSAIYNQV